MPLKINSNDITEATIVDLLRITNRKYFHFLHLRKTAQNPCFITCRPIRNATSVQLGGLGAILEYICGENLPRIRTLNLHSVCHVDRGNDSVLVGVIGERLSSSTTKQCYKTATNLFLYTGSEEEII